MLWIFLLPLVWLANIFMSILIPVSGAWSFLALPLLQIAPMEYKIIVYGHKSAELGQCVNAENRDLNVTEDYYLVGVQYLLDIHNSCSVSTLPMFQREFSVSNIETFFFWMLQWLFSPWLSSSAVKIPSGNNGGGRTWEGRRGGREGVFEICFTSLCPEEDPECQRNFPDQVSILKFSCNVGSKSHRIIKIGKDLRDQVQPMSKYNHAH